MLGVKLILSALLMIVTFTMVIYDVSFWKIALTVALVLLIGALI